MHQIDYAKPTDDGSKDTLVWEVGSNIQPTQAHSHDQTGVSRPEEKSREALATLEHLNKIYTQSYVLINSIL